MQSYKGDQLIDTQSGTHEQLQRRAAEFELLGIRSVIGEIPAEGTILQINDLEWIVDKVNSRAGWMRLRIRKPS